MKKYGLLGEKLGHSYSKLIHEWVYQYAKIEASYELIECSSLQLKDYIDKLRTGEYYGYNVTIPYKKEVLRYLDVIDVKAQAIGSVNTIYYQDGKVIGTNTDSDGFAATLDKYSIDVKNKDCYILGTGGASLAIAYVVKEFGGKPIFVSRKPVAPQIGYAELEKRDIDVLINTTPVGMYPLVEVCPVSDKTIQKSKVVMDIIFNPSQTLLLKKANSNMNGLYMLIIQALRAEEFWQQRFFKELEEKLVKKLQKKVL